MPVADQSRVPERFADPDDFGAGCDRPVETTGQGMGYGDVVVGEAERFGHRHFGQEVDRPATSGNAFVGLSQEEILDRQDTERIAGGQRIVGRETVRDGQIRRVSGQVMPAAKARSQTSQPDPCLPAQLSVAESRNLVLQPVQCVEAALEGAGEVQALTKPERRLDQRSAGSHLAGLVQHADRALQMGDRFGQCPACSRVLACAMEVFESPAPFASELGMLGD